MKKYSLVALVLLVYTAEMAAMHRIALRRFATATKRARRQEPTVVVRNQVMPSPEMSAPSNIKTALKITGGMALGFNTAALLTNQCPFVLAVKPGAREKLGKSETTALEFGTIAGATLAAGMWGAGISLPIVAIMRHRHIASDHFKSLEVNKIVPTEITDAEKKAE